ncbi:hypothetical protein GCM10011583_46320 [Streptomyces camponoticapitis]|uniref:Uncharacterized protein n=1 Tax=Streptomyces camponoticapitis TaxID=1616125 RepID=A0ABQ2EH53_9ACTN|nr:hypothetical protein GCM10011583_46320 [Streptomyces camponoticapitis]
MSTIHNCCVALGSSDALRNGSAKYSTVMSIDIMRTGTTRTARPTHSFKVARSGLMESTLDLYK